MVDRLGKAIGVIASIVLFLMMMLSTIDVIGRNFLDAPILGASELVELAMVIMVFLIYPRAAYRNAHVSVDLFDPFMNDIVRRLQSVVANLLGAFMFGLISWRLAIFGVHAAEFRDVTGTLQVPMSYVYWFMAIMSAVTAISFLLNIRSAFPRRPFSSTPASQGHK
jgi:TRAP-type transport system small permease protein